MCHSLGVAMRWGRWSGGEVDLCEDRRSITCVFTFTRSGTLVPTEHITLYRSVSIGQISKYLSAQMPTNYSMGGVHKDLHTMYVHTRQDTSQQWSVGRGVWSSGGGQAVEGLVEVVEGLEEGLGEGLENGWERVWKMSSKRVWGLVELISQSIRSYGSGQINHEQHHISLDRVQIESGQTLISL